MMITLENLDKFIKEYGADHKIKFIKDYNGRWVFRYKKNYFKVGISNNVYEVYSCGNYYLGLDYNAGTSSISVGATSFEELERILSRYLNRNYMKNNVVQGKLF